MNVNPQKGLGVLVPKCSSENLYQLPLDMLFYRESFNASIYVFLYMPDNLYRAQRKEDFARHAKRGFMVTRINKIERALFNLSAHLTAVIDTTTSKINHSML